MPEIVTPPTAPPASTPPAEPLAQSFDQTFPDDGLDSPPSPQPPPPAEPPPAEPPETPPTGDKPKTEPTTAKVPPKETPPAAPEGDKPPEFTPPTVGKASEIRAWAARVGKWAEKMTSKADKLQAKLAQLESQPPKQAEDTANLAQELATAKKRLEQYENDIRLTKYERSQEYAEKYQKPYQDAISRAYREVKELLVSEPNPDDPENPRERAATQADFDEIYGMPLGLATRTAKQKFGDAAMIVLQHRQQIRQLAESAYAAVEEYKTKGGEVETQTKAQQVQHEQAMKRMFDMATEGHAKRAPELFQERDGDDEGNELLTKGRNFAATVFSGNDGLTPQQVAFRDAMAYNRLAAYPRILRDLKKAQTELAESQKTIESLRSSGPGPVKPSAGKKEETPNESWETAFDKLPG